MQTLNRAKLIFRAHVNDLLEKAEDRHKTRQLRLEEMREDIRSVKSFIASAIADLKLIERQIDENEAEAKRWDERAVFALKKGEEDLARRALVRKQEHTKRSDRYREQLNTQRETIETLKESLKALESKLDTMRYSAAKLSVYEQREESLSRHRAAHPSTSADVVIDTGAIDAYDRMVERVQDMEAHAEALAELTRGDELEQKFHELESKDDVERDLEALKAKVATEA